MKLKFSDDFVFGSAFSGPQTEGNKNKKGENIFDKDFSDNPKEHFESKFVLNNFYDNYKEDIRLAKSLGLKELRTSIQGSRLIPDGQNVDKEAVMFYNNVIDEMIKNDIAPSFALHHYDMPTGAQKMGGGLSREVIEKFVFYAEKAFSLFGDRVTKGFTFNEPQCVPGDGYINMKNPPFIKDAKKAVQVQGNSLIAHHKCVALHKKMNLKSRYGVILVLCAAMPAKNTKEDIEAAELMDMFKGRCYSDPIFKGEYPKKFEEKLEEVGIKFEEEEGDRELIKNNTIDFFGLNYYYPSWAKEPSEEKKHMKVDENGMPVMFENYKPPYTIMNSSREWVIFPYGIYYSIMKIKELYGNKIEIYITENGMGVQNEYVFEDENKLICDDYRIDFFKMHLYYVLKAKKEGANINGFHTGAYIDNWSGRNAYKNRYGSISLNIKTGERKFKKSAYGGKELIKTREFTMDEKLINSPFLTGQKEGK